MDIASDTYRKVSSGIRKLCSKAYVSLDPEGQATKTNYLTILVESVAFVGAILFLLGLSYGRTYYTNIGINFSLLEFQVTTIMSWSAYLIEKKPITFFVIPLLTVIALVMFVNHSSQLLQRQNLRIRKPLGYFLLFAWVAIVFYLAVYFLPDKSEELALHDATRDKIASESYLPKVRVLFKQPDGARTPEYMELLDDQGLYSDRGYRYVGLHKGYHYFLTVSDSIGNGKTVLYSVSVDVVGAVIHVLRN